MNVKLLGIIDEDPFDAHTWSGSSLYFFNALKSADVLYRAISAYPPTIIRTAYKILSIQAGYQKWRFRYHLNTGLFDQMTAAARSVIDNLDTNEFNTILQVGAWYNLTDTRGKTFVSYHDGNLAVRLKSPYGYPEIRQKYIDRAYEYEKNLYAGMDYIFPMSKWLARSFIEDFDVNARKVIPVGAGINLPRIMEPAEKNAGNHKILFVGVDFERKGGQVLLDAFSNVRKKIRGVELNIVGPAHIENLPDGARCLGRISKQTDEGLDKLLKLYSEASIFVLPSLYEPFGIAFAEAMAHKLPCIGSSICAMPEIIDEGVNGFLVEPNNSKSLEDRILMLLGDNSLRESMGEAAYRKYYNNYRWDIVTGKITGVLESGASRPVVLKKPV